MNKIEHPFFDESYHYKEIASTSKKAENIIKNGIASGNFLVTALTQKTGIGRKGAAWYSPEGGIWMTSGLYNLQVEVNITLFIGIMIHKSILQLLPQLKKSLKIKWPNDIFINDLKMCGIIANYLPSHKYHLLGIGIDTNISDFTAELKGISTSTLLETETEIDNEELIKTIFDNFSATLPDFMMNGLKNYHKYYEENSYLKGKNIILDTEFKQFSGNVKGINKKGALLLQMGNGMIQPLYSGSVVWVEK
jgi:BirA family biotin operon repressor/biotin-[acetyl-CoA-carboxylase] ligase